MNQMTTRANGGAITRQAPAEPDLDAHDPASGELAAQWLYGNGFKELAYVIRTQLDMRGARIRELSASTPAAPGIDIEHFHRAVQRICIKFDGDLPYISGIAEVLDLIDASPKGDDVPHRDLVPGVMRCAKCAFQLHRTNLYLGSGTTGPGDSKTEPCPNGCGPLCPVTWQTWATEGWQQAERYFEELRQLQDSPKGGSEAPLDGEVLVMVSGLTGSGKSAVAGEIEILCKALGLEVEWVDSEEEKRLTHSDWTEALELYKPRVRIVEVNIPRAQAGDAEVRPCETCGPDGIMATDGSGPFDCYACGKKANSHGAGVSA